MSVTALGAIIEIGGKVFDKMFPDPVEAERAKFELFKLQQTGEFKALEADIEMAKGQVEINKEEAKSELIFKSGWRPFIGWTCGSAFAFNFLILPIATMVAAFYGIPFVGVTPIDLTTMLPVLLGMLGLGGMRTFEKVRNKQ